MAVTLTQITLMNNAFSAPIDQLTDVIGMDGLGVNLHLEVTMGFGEMPPPFIDVTFLFKEPNLGRRGKSSFFLPAPARVPRVGLGRTYRLQLPADQSGLMLIPDAQLEVATVVRADDPAKPATADKAFRAPLLQAGWSLRGVGRQAKGNSLSGGNLITKEPDGKALMRTGGVEVVEIVAQPQFGLTVAAPGAWGFLRSPADVFFYTGHGIGGDLVTHPTLDTFLKPEQVRTAWAQTTLTGRVLVETHVLILNGCAALKGTAAEWRNLLTDKGGPLSAVLGYRNTAPLDKDGGEAVAAAMGKRIAGLGDKWADYPRAWMEVNKAEFRPGQPSGLSLLANARAIEPGGKTWNLIEKDGKVDIVEYLISVPSST
jgi:hypothetical protein